MVRRKVGKILGLKHFGNKVILEEVAVKAIRQAVHGRNVQEQWFQASNHEVKIIILAKFDEQQHHILLEKWEEEISSPQGAIMRSRAATMQQNGILNPVKRQSITITRDETTNPVSYNVTRGVLVLGFRLLFLRDPGPQEGDFVLSIQDLQLFAEKVWAELPRSD
ncbi:hypothetical protein B0T24DRAFT_612824 [Lasiosphaeria ovina]|uniref:Uncharacterized protein n=1 Tax=Lasiosphaeria ovina TaxID=92902 RepID=A0AAE0NE07_9PEZI|nr:hypothetical protein B0T24DRAFT_612824 [Lasiosphaeria ovina]